MIFKKIMLIYLVNRMAFSWTMDEDEFQKLYTRFLNYSKPLDDLKEQKPAENSNTDTESPISQDKSEEKFLNAYQCIFCDEIRLSIKAIRRHIAKTHTNYSLAYNPVNGRFSFKVIQIKKDQLPNIELTNISEEKPFWPRQEKK